MEETRREREFAHNARRNGHAWPPLTGTTASAAPTRFSHFSQAPSALLHDKILTRSDEDLEAATVKRVNQASDRGAGRASEFAELANKTFDVTRRHCRLNKAGQILTLVDVTAAVELSVRERRKAGGVGQRLTGRARDRNPLGSSGSASNAAQTERILIAKTIDLASAHTSSEKLVLTSHSSRVRKRGRAEVKRTS